MKSLYNRLDLIVLAIFLTALALVMCVSTFSAKIADASAPSGLPATIATTTKVVMASRTAGPVIATSTCSARIISTQGVSIMLTFSDFQGDTPTASLGIGQAASTTVAYDSGQYGCGLVKAWADAATSITVIDSR